MRKSSFTDEQLLNLVDNFILKETQHTPEEFTGGSVQVTYSPFHNIISYSVFIFFGYDDKKNSISVKKKITSQFQDVWYDAINCKTSSMASVANGVELNELNELMNGQDDSTVDSTVLVQGKVLGNRYKVLGNRYKVRYGNGSTPFVTTSLRSPYEVAIDEDKATEETKQTLLKTDESKADVDKELFEEIWRTYVLDVVKPSTGRNSESKTEAMKSFVKVRKLNISKEVLFECLENHYNETTDKKYLKKLKTLLDDTLTLKEMQKEYNNANK